MTSADDGTSPHIWIVTDLDGGILRANPGATAMLAVAEHNLRGRSLILFIDHDRIEWDCALAAAGHDQTVERIARIRPRDRRPLIAHVKISRVRMAEGQRSLLWCFSITSSGE